MIYVHTYGYGKFGKKICRTIHDNQESAKAQQTVLGGEVKAFVEQENCIDIAEHVHMIDVIKSEVSEIIDDFSSKELGGAGNFEAGSPEWDCRKLEAINMIQQIADGDY